MAVVPIVSRDNRDVNPQVWDYFLITVKRNVIYFSSKFVCLVRMDQKIGSHPLFWKMRFGLSCLGNSLLYTNFSFASIRGSSGVLPNLGGGHDVGSVSPSDQFPGILRWEVILITSRYPYDWEEINLGVSIISYFESIWVCGLNW
jgi:hypothetical protein